MNLLSSERLRQSDTDKRRRDGDLKFDYRLPIESDYGRLVFSSSFRRLHDKTQVFPLTTNDNIHSRLTHSIEVASVGKSFALNIIQNKNVCSMLGLNCDDPTLWRSISTLLELICLAHDIGNPPLGHFGETAIKCYFTNLFDSVKQELERCKDNPDLLRTSKNAIIRSEIDNNRKIDAFFRDFFGGNTPLAYDYTEFDGNAQGFRVITKLQFLNDLYGLNLTSASLASFIKYPNIGHSSKGYIGEHKHGVFKTEGNYLNDVMKNCGISSRRDGVYNRHPFSFLMEAADTICYLLMDLEDAIGKGWLSYYDLRKILESHEDGHKIVHDAGNHFFENDPQKKKIVQLRTELMGYLVKIAWNNFEKNCEDIVSGKYEKELLYDDKDSSLAGILHDYSQKKVYSNTEIESLELTGEAVITGLLDKYVKYLFNSNKHYRLHGKHVISRSVFMTTLHEHLGCFSEGAKAWDEYDNFDPVDLSYEEKFRIIRDHVACMTDKYALEQYRKLSGEKI